MALAQGSLELEALSSRCSGVPWLHFLTMPDPFDEETDLRAVLRTLNPKARDDLRRVLIRDQADRDAVASQLLRYRDGHGDDWADIIDMLTMHPEARRKIVRLLGETQAES